EPESVLMAHDEVPAMPPEVRHRDGVHAEVTRLPGDCDYAQRPVRHRSGSAADVGEQYLHVTRAIRRAERPTRDLEPRYLRLRARRHVAVHCVLRVAR